MKFLYLFVFLAFTGCFKTEVAPNLKIPDFESTRPSLNMPPVSKNVVLVIDGDNISPITNDGGKLLLKYYVLAREKLSK